MKKILLSAILSVAGCAGSTAPAADSAYRTPEQAVGALAAAVERSDLEAVQAMFGPGGKEILFSGDPVADRNARASFRAHFSEKHSLDKVDDHRYVLLVGEDEWPFPVPLVKSESGWKFDGEAGKEEVVNRRIGMNELQAIDLLMGVADAQDDYFQNDWDRDGVREYAQRFLSTHGEKDGLFWARKPGEPPSPLGAIAAAAAAEGYRPGATPQPVYGYMFRVLSSEVKGGGKPKSFLSGKNMTRNFAVIAYPAEYGVSGVMTFAVDKKGKVLETDLGPETARVAGDIGSFDPGAGWEAVD